MRTVEQAEDNARHNDAGKHRFDGNKVVAKLRAHLFNDEKYTRQRRVKGGRQPGRRAGRQQRVARFVTANTQQIEHHARAQRAHPAEKLHRDNAPPAYGTQLFQRAFDFRDARACGFRRKAAYEKIAHHRQQRGERKRQRVKLPAAEQRRIGQRQTPVLYPVNRAGECAADQPDDNADQRGGDKHCDRDFIAVKQRPEHAIARRDRLRNVN